MVRTRTRSQHHFMVCFFFGENWQVISLSHFSSSSVKRKQTKPNNPGDLHGLNTQSIEGPRDSAGHMVNAQKLLESKEKKIFPEADHPKRSKILCFVSTESQNSVSERDFIVSVWWLAFFFFSFIFLKRGFFQQNIIRKLTCQKHIKMEVGLGRVEKWAQLYQTAFPSSLPWKTLRRLPLSRTQSENPNVWFSSTISHFQAGPRDVKLFFRWHDQSYNCIPVTFEYSTTRKNGQDPDTWECLTKLLSKFKICALFPLQWMIIFWVAHFRFHVDFLTFFFMPLKAFPVWFQCFYQP